MLAVRDNLAECFDALRAHKLRASLTMLGLTMGVATLITVMTLVQGANVYVEQKTSYFSRGSTSHQFRFRNTTRMQRFISKFDRQGKKAVKPCKFFVNF